MQCVLYLYVMLKYSTYVCVCVRLCVCVCYVWVNVCVRVCAQRCKRHVCTILYIHAEPHGAVELAVGACDVGCRV